MQMDSEFAGILVGAGFVLMGLVSMPIATWFFLGALILGGGVALLLRFRKEKKTSSVIFSPTKR
jgi:F0F1-type ATP synthase assembly protein I